MRVSYDMQQDMHTDLTKPVRVSNAPSRLERLLTRLRQDNPDRPITAKDVADVIEFLYGDLNSKIEHRG